MLSVKSPYEISNLDKVELWAALHMSIYYHQNPHSFTVQNLGGVNLVRHIEVNPNFLGTEYESICLKTTLKLYVRLRRNRVSFFDRVTGGDF